MLNSSYLLEATDGAKKMLNLKSIFKNMFLFILALDSLVCLLFIKCES